MGKSSASRKGRPRVGTPVTVRLADDMIRDLDDLAEIESKLSRNPTGRADAMRLAIGHGIEAMKKINKQRS